MNKENRELKEKIKELQLEVSDQKTLIGELKGDISDLQMELLQTDEPTIEHLLPEDCRNLRMVMALNIVLENIRDVDVLDLEVLANKSQKLSMVLS